MCTKIWILNTANIHCYMYYNFSIWSVTTVPYKMTSCETEILGYINPCTQHSIQIFRTLFMWKLFKIINLTINVLHGRLYNTSIVCIQSCVSFAKILTFTMKHFSMKLFIWIIFLTFCVFSNHRIEGLHFLGAAWHFKGFVVPLKKQLSVKISLLLYFCIHIYIHVYLFVNKYNAILI